MLSRALSLATAMLFIGFAAPSSLIAPAAAQNLEAGKSPAQLFSANCSVCHKSARGLLKSVPPGDLPGFLRQHYTTSADMAKIMSGYLVANGAGGGRKPNDDGLTRQGRELTREQQPAPGDAAPANRRQRPAAAERPQAQPAPDAAPATESAPRRSRNAKRQPPAETAAPAGETQSPAAAESERPPAKQKLGKKGRRHQEEPPKADTVKDAAKPETDNAGTDKAEPPKTEPAKSEPAREAIPPKPAEASKPETPPAMRADPVPAVTPAPKDAEPSSSTPVSPPAVSPAPEPAKPSAD